MYHTTQNTVEEVPCWNCGAIVQSVNSFYLCKSCNVAHSQGRDPMPMFTTPGYSIRRTRLTPPYAEFHDPYIDFATTWAPTP